MPILMKYRHRVLILLFFLSIITYLDRVCIAVAGPQMQKDLDISPEQWGWVVGVFAITYALFEIPSGALGDRIGPRKVLTRIVVWWSGFTFLTGTVSNFRWLLVTQMRSERVKQARSRTVRAPSPAGSRRSNAAARRGSCGWPAASAAQYRPCSSSRFRCCGAGALPSGLSAGSASSGLPCGTSGCATRRGKCPASRPRRSKRSRKARRP